MEVKKGVKLVAFIAILFIFGGTGLLSIIMGIGGIIVGGISGQAGAAFQGSVVYFVYAIISVAVLYFARRFLILNE